MYVNCISCIQSCFLDGSPDPSVFVGWCLSVEKIQILRMLLVINEDYEIMALLNYSLVKLFLAPARRPGQFYN